jgi:hypothetical protein
MYIVAWSAWYDENHIHISLTTQHKNHFDTLNTGQ